MALWERIRSGLGLRGRDAAEPSMPRDVKVALLCGVWLLLPSTATAVEQPDGPRACKSLTDTRIANPRSARIRVEELAGQTVIVLLPPGYDDGNRRYPVLYLAQGGGATVDCFLRATDLIRYSAAQPPSRQAIVVMPDGGAAPLWIDWRHGRQYESILREAIIPHLDATYRTLAGRGHRAIAGFSGGGGGAMSFAARNPHLFAAAGSFSGTVDVDPDEPDDLVAAIAATLAEPSLDPFAAAGNPATDAVWWLDINPPELASNLDGMRIWFASGNQQPCDAADVSEALTLLPFTALEEYAHRQAEELDRALARAGVPHTYDEYGCGIHSYRYVERDIHVFWSVMHEAFGRRVPRVFDFRRARPDFSVWGWSFEADPRRAVEFLDIRDASRHGLTLTGSGTEAVRTARYFEPGESVRLDGAVERQVRADRRGRISFHVDLGPPHPNQQHTLEARLAGQDSPGYFTTRRVMFA